MGFQEIVGWDSDIMENHNLSSTAYPVKSVGLRKIEAAKRLNNDYGEDWQTFEGKANFTRSDEPMPHMILATDDMESRRMVYESWKKLNKGFLIDARMGATVVELATSTPTNDNYMNTWVPTNSVPSAPCSMKHTVYATQHIASLVASQVYNLLAGLAYHEYIWSNLSPNTVEYGTLIRPQPQGVVNGNNSKESLNRLGRNANGNDLLIHRSA